MMDRIIRLHCIKGAEFTNVKFNRDSPSYMIEIEPSWRLPDQHKDDRFAAVSA